MSAASPNTDRCFWTERTVSGEGRISWCGREYRAIQHGLEGARVTVVETRGGRILFEHGDQVYAARLAPGSPASPSPGGGGGPKEAA